MKNSLCLVSFSLTKFPRAIATRTHGLALVEPHLHMMPTSLFYNFVVFWKCNKKKTWSHISLDARENCFIVDKTKKGEQQLKSLLSNKYNSQVSKYHKMLKIFHIQSF